MELAQLKEAVIAGDMARTKSLTEEALEAGIEPASILNDALISGMDKVGELFKVNEVYVPEVLLAAKSMQNAMAVLKPLRQNFRMPADGLTADKKKRSSLFLTYTDQNQKELARLVEAFKTQAQELGVSVDMADNQDI